MMLTSFLLGIAITGLVCADGPVVQRPEDDYAAVKARADRSADAQVKLALWCEAHGLTAERTRHLMLAVLRDPANATARGLLGLVPFRGKWQSPGEVARRLQDDPDRKAVLQDYLQRRARTPDRPDDQWTLALWCEEHALKDQATAHLYQVLKRDPRREAAWKRLGFRKQGGRWVKPEALAAEKAEAETQARATKSWKPRLEKWREALKGRDRERKAVAQESLARVVDPYAVPAVMAVFGHGGEAQQKIALELLGKIDAPAASRALAMLAVFSGSATVRGQAAGILRRRDAREFADLLVSLVQQPIEFEVKRVGGPDAAGELLIKGQGTRPNLRRIYRPPTTGFAMQPGDLLLRDNSGASFIRRPISRLALPAYAGGYNTDLVDRDELRQLGLWRSPSLDPVQKLNFMVLLTESGLGLQEPEVGRQILDSLEDLRDLDSVPLQILAQSGTPLGPETKVKNVIGLGIDIPLESVTGEAQRSIMAAGAQLERDVRSIRDHNASLRELNDRVVPVLRDVSGLDLGARRPAWEGWFVDQLGYQARRSPPPERETVIEQAPIDYQPVPLPAKAVIGPIGIDRISCFGAGTLVQTLAGPRPIEQVAIGDQVLTQDTRNGGLDYHPVLVVHHNPPGRTFKITLGEEEIVSSVFHRFWKAGQGWVMARDLVVGDAIRTLNGIVRVARIEEGQVVPVYNLDVAAAANFFVGRSTALVHDNSLPDPRQPPFDRLPAEPERADSPLDDRPASSTRSKRR